MRLNALEHSRRQMAPLATRMGQLQDRLGIPGSTLSHHCRALVQVALILQERQGTTVLCRANYPVMQGLLADLAAECCVDAGDRA